MKAEITPVTIDISKYNHMQDDYHFYMNMVADARAEKVETMIYFYEARKMGFIAWGRTAEQAVNELEAAIGSAGA